MDNLKYKGYQGTVEYSAVGNCLVGKVMGMSKDSITYEGRDLDELKADFEAGIDSYLEGCTEMGIEPRKAFSGTLNIRISPDIHGRIAILAQQAGVTINAFIKEALENQVKLSNC